MGGGGLVPVGGPGAAGQTGVARRVVQFSRRSQAVAGRVIRGRILEAQRMVTPGGGSEVGEGGDSRPLVRYAHGAQRPRERSSLGSQTKGGRDYLFLEDVQGSDGILPVVRRRFGGDVVCGGAQTSASHAVLFYYSSDLIGRLEPA